MQPRTVSTKKRRPVHTPWGYDESMGEHCREILARLDWPNRNTEMRTLGFTSCRGGEGVSTVAAQVASAAAAQNEGRVLLVEANVLRPSVAERFSIASGPGFVECLQNEDKHEDGTAEEMFSEAVQQVGQPGLWVLTSGKMRGSPAKLFNSPALPKLVHHMARQFDLVVFDLPHVGVASCAQQLTVTLDGVLLVVEADSTRWDAARRVKELLHGAGARVLGGVLNKYRESH
jgi:protein-tyrosine kinase